MNTKPIISVIVPVYNVEKYLARCLDSIIAQSYKHLEIICVNDGSPDNSRAILQDYAEKDGRIIVIDKPNGGLSSARNAGMARATGEFISFVDSDDYINEDCYEACIKHFTDDVDVVSFSYVEVDDKGNKHYPKQYLNGKVLFSEGMLFQQSWNVWNKIFRTSTLKKYNMLFREGVLYEDLEFCARFFLVCRPVVVHLQDDFYNYYHNVNSIIGKTLNKIDGMSIQHIYQLDSIYNFLKENNAIAYSKNDFLKICEYCFKSAVNYAPAKEVAKCYVEMIKRLEEYKFDYKGYPLLDCLSNGNYSIKLNNDVQISKLKGFENIFCIKKELGLKVLRLFGKRIYTF